MTPSPPAAPKDQDVKSISAIRAAVCAAAILAPGLAGGRDTDHPTRDHELLRAIEMVESGGRHDAIGDGGAAVGILQLHRIYVDECNRILTLQRSPVRYRYEDRRHVQRSREMFWVVSRYWNRHWERRGSRATRETTARRHNGGPRGHLKQATAGYWRKVRSHLAHR